MHRRIKPEESDEQPSFHERLLMAFLLPIFFNISLIIVVCTFSRRSRTASKLLLYGMHWSAWILSFLFIILPAIIGFKLGPERCTNLLGHFFYTNMGHEKSFPKTLLCWGVFVAIAYVLSKLIPAT